MGTNYFWRDKPCGSCGRYDEYHVCKSRVTWRAYPHQLFNSAHPEWGFDPDSFTGYPILSLADWRRVFTERPGELRDEYGKTVTDPLAWLAEATPRTGALDEDMRDGSGWHDDQGFLFYCREFS